MFNSRSEHSQHSAITFGAAFCSSGEIAHQILQVNGLFKILWDILKNGNPMDAIYANCLSLLNCLLRYRFQATAVHVLASGGIPIASEAFRQAISNDDGVLVRLLYSALSALRRDPSCNSVIESIGIFKYFQSKRNLLREPVGNVKVLKLNH